MPKTVCATQKTLLLEPMKQQIPVTEGAEAIHRTMDKERGDGSHEITADLAYKRLVMVNIMFYGLPGGAGNGPWVLIDAGLPGTAGLIASNAAARFGEGPPRAIILTHGHFDHAGALETLAERYEVPIYAHELEFPYLNGTSSYPRGDASVGGGMMALLAPLYPRGPVDVSRWLKVLPADGSVPEMEGWKWIHTPGHTPGHVSLWRESDRTIIAGDAFITTNQESAYGVMTQKPELHGPPMQCTQNWEQSKTSVQKLAALEPELVISGHGQALRGAEMRRALHKLANTFDETAVPEHGKYVTDPATAESGTAYK